MNASSPKGIALFLTFVGIALVLAVLISAVVIGNQRLMFIASTGLALQLLGWRLLADQKEGRS